MCATGIGSSYDFLLSIAISGIGAIVLLKNCIGLHKTAPTRPPPNTTEKVFMTAEIRMSYLGEVPREAWAERA